MLRDCLNDVGIVLSVAAGCLNRNMVPVCGYCGERGHFMRACPKEKIVCGKCGVNGHRTQICKARVNDTEPNT